MRRIVMGMALHHPWLTTSLHQGLQRTDSKHKVTRRNLHSVESSCHLHLHLHALHLYFAWMDAMMDDEHRALVLQKSRRFHQVLLVCQSIADDAPSISCSCRMIWHDDALVFEWPIGSKQYWGHFRILLWLWQLGIAYERHLNNTSVDQLNLDTALSYFKTFDGIVRLSPYDDWSSQWRMLMHRVDHGTMTFDVGYDDGHELIAISDDQSHTILSNTFHRDHVCRHLDAKVLAIMIEHAECYPTRWLALCLHRHGHLAWLDHHASISDATLKHEPNMDIMEALQQRWQDDDGVVAGGSLLDDIQSTMGSRWVHQHKIKLTQPRQATCVMDAWTAHQWIRLKHDAVIPFQGMRKELKRLCKPQHHFSWKMPYRFTSHPVQDSSPSVHRTMDLNCYREWLPGPDDDRLVLAADHQPCRACQLTMDVHTPALVDTKLPNATWPGHRSKIAEQGQWLSQYAALKCRRCETRICWSCLIRAWITRSIEAMDRSHRPMHCLTCPCQNVIIPWHRLWPIAYFHATQWHAIDTWALTHQDWLDVVMPITVANAMVWQRWLDQPDRRHVQCHRVDGLLTDHPVVVMTMGSNAHVDALDWLKIVLKPDSNLDHARVQVVAWHTILSSWPSFQNSLAVGNVQAWLESDVCPQCGMDHVHNTTSNLLADPSTSMSDDMSASPSEASSIVLLQCQSCHTRYCRTCRMIIADQHLVDHPTSWSWISVDHIASQLKRKWNGRLKVLQGMPGSCRPTRACDRPSYHQLIKSIFVKQTWIEQT